MNVLGNCARVLLAELRRFAGDRRLNARIAPMEWFAIAKKAGLSDQSRREAITDLLRERAHCLPARDHGNHSVSSRGN